MNGQRFGPLLAFACLRLRITRIDALTRALLLSDLGLSPAFSAGGGCTLKNLANCQAVHSRWPTDALYRL